MDMSVIDVKVVHGLDSIMDQTKDGGVPFVVKTFVG